MALAQPTQTRIYNRTLALLGSVQRSSGPDDGSSVTDTLNAHWDTAVRGLIAEHPWNFAIARATLNPQEEATEDGGWWFQLPAECLRWLPPGPDTRHYFAGVQEGNRILTNRENPIRIRYLTVVEDVSSWPPHFVEAMAYRMAMDAAEAITQSATIANAMRVMYEGDDGEGGALAKAKRADGLASGDRERGGVVARSRALTAASHGGAGPFFHPPSHYWD